MMNMKIAAFSNSLSPDKAVLSNSYLFIFPDDKSEILAVFLSKVYSSKLY